MPNNNNIPSDRWSDLLTHYCEKKEITDGIGKVVRKEGRSFIHINGKDLDQQDILNISTAKTESDLSLESIQKLKTSFSLYLEKENARRTNEILPSLKSFSSIISRWANNHQTLAKILSFITFGFFRRIWDQGNTCHQKAKENQETINHFQNLVDRLKEKRGINETYFPSETRINNIIIDYLDAEDKKVMMGWRPLKEAIKKDYSLRLKAIFQSYQKEFISYLDPNDFKNEIHEIKSLRSLIHKDKKGSFADLRDPTLEEYWIRVIIETELGKILNLSETFWSNRMQNAGHRPRVAPHKCLLEQAKNKNFALFLVRTCEFAYGELDDQLKSDRDIIVSALKRSHETFKQLPETLKNDRSFILEAFKTTGRFFQHLSDDLRKDRDIVIKAIEADSSNINYAPLFHNDREIMLLAVKNYPQNIHTASEELKKDREFVRVALEHRFTMKSLANVPHFKDDKELVLAAAKHSWQALEDASNRLKDDEEVVFAAASNFGLAFDNASQRLREDYNFVLKLVSKHGDAIACAEKFKNNKEIVLAAVKNKGTALKYVSKDLRADPEVFLAAVWQNGKALKEGSEQQRDDINNVLAAVSNHGPALKWASDSLKKYKEAVLAAVKEDISAYEFSPLRDDKDIALVVVQENGSLLQHFSERLRNDEEVVSAAVKNYGMALEFASPALRNNKKIALEALKDTIYAEEWISADLKKDIDIKRNLDYYLQ